MKLEKSKPDIPDEYLGRIWLADSDDPKKEILYFYDRREANQEVQELIDRVIRDQCDSGAALSEDLKRLFELCEVE